MNAIARAAKLHPTWVAYLATAIVWAGGRYGVHVDAEAASVAAGVLLTAGLAVAHHYTTPVAAPRDAAGRPLVAKPLPFEGPATFRRGPGPERSGD